jgi:hypothetical protein
MSNRGKGEEPGLEEPGPIHFGAEDEALSDEPGPIRFGGGPAPPPKMTPTPAASGDPFDFENGPSIVLPSYITRAAQSWDPDSPARAKAKAPPEPEPSAPEAPPAPAFKATVEPPEPEPRSEAPPRAAPPRDEEPTHVYQPPPRRRTVPRPEPTYGVIRSKTPPDPAPSAVAKAQKGYFTPLPEAGRALIVPPPPPQPPAREPETVVAAPEKPLIQIQINGLPLFQGNNLLRGLFFGCLVGVAVGGIAAVLLDLLAPHAPPPPAPVFKVLNAEVAAPTEPAPEPNAKPRKGARGYPRTVTNTVVEPPPAIRVQSAPPPRAVIRPGTGQPLQADPNAR